jgi:hypothetical protein
MKFGEKIKESSLKEDDFDSFETDFVEPEYAEVEMVVAEPTKITDIDGSVVIATPGDTVTIKSESLKRINSKKVTI